MSKQMVELGDEVECLISGLKGIAVAYAKHITGCDRVHVQPPVDKEGKPRDGWWVDLHSLKILSKAKVKIDQPEEAKAKGGFMSRNK